MSLVSCPVTSAPQIRLDLEFSAEVGAGASNVWEQHFITVAGSADLAVQHSTVSDDVNPGDGVEQIAQKFDARRLP